ncbi:nuclear envelope integral membrane protein 1 isoform X2 [Ceratina calcarata]|uniref:Nuclear envelope integral membrane protein 1 isoform X2 n=1 Tax=Ceratina calcarata TaxID=156304 RepID=A0AAJ7JGA0_9HYME|nr:nuclear envelope integral membrane protein 1 isoform X2 [Ceratina calcarata]
MRRLSIIIIVLFCNCFHKDSSATNLQPTSTPSVHHLNSGDMITNCYVGLEIFCYTADKKYLMNMWKSLTIHLDASIDNLDLYDGKTPDEVVQKHHDKQRSWGLNFFTTKKNVKLKFSPFENFCIGVDMYRSNLLTYTLSVTHDSVDNIQVALMVLGIVLYWSARKLSESALFYYFCGIMFGLITSFMILVYFTSKFLLRGKLMYLMVVTGWTMSFYLFHFLWENAQLIALQYREMIVWYILSVSGVSFIICYWFGPVTNPRTKKIMQWFLQIAGLCAMYYSSYLREASLLCCVINVLLYNFATPLFRKGRNYWKSMFPIRRKLLTEVEYRKEGVKETKNALTKLKEYCSSPDCNPWKTVLRLRDPIRFARFMEGEPHVSDNEVQQCIAQRRDLENPYDLTEDEDDF